MEFLHMQNLFYFNGGVQMEANIVNRFIIKK